MPNIHLGNSRATENFDENIGKCSMSQRQCPFSTWLQLKKIK